MGGDFRMSEMHYIKFKTIGDELEIQKCIRYYLRQRIAEDEDDEKYCNEDDQPDNSLQH